MISPVSYLSATASRGPAERLNERSEFVTYDSADLDIKFLLALKRIDARLAPRFHIPMTHLCVDAKGDMRFCHTPCAADQLCIRAGLLLAGRGADRALLLPPDFAQLISSSPNRFVIFNFGIAQTKHANAFVVDRARRLVSRFDPVGTQSTHALVEAALKRALPRYAVEQHEHHRAIQNSHTDSFHGMCVTFSVLYVLTTLLNPDRSPREVHAHLASLPPRTLRTWVLRLNRRIADVLRITPRGSLSMQRGRCRDAVKTKKCKKKKTKKATRRAMSFHALSKNR